MKKERLARGWSLREFAAHTGINIGHASRIENGKRPPTEKVAVACDSAFPERRGWFSAYYDELSMRLTARMERQRRLWARAVPTWFLVDELSLYRQLGTPEVMAAQIRHLLTVTARPDVTLQVLPAVGHPATGSEIIIADESAYAEHAASGFVYTGETVTALARIFDSLRSECRKASESTALLERMAEAWTGGNPLTAEPTAGPASRRPATTARSW
jgi:transcriptional regulator with XRE-family HTH domain